MKKKIKAYLIIGILYLFSLLPWCLVQKFGTLAGWLMWVFPNRSREVARINISKCFPELSSDEVDELVKKNLVSTGKTFAECICAWLWPAQKTLTFIKEVEGLDVLQRALASGKGVVGVTNHLGNWEILNHYFSSQSNPIIFYRPLKMEALERLLQKRRVQVGNRVAPSTKEGILSVIKEVRKGGVVGIPADPEPTRSAGIFVPFFGTQALISKFVPNLVAGGKAVVVLCHAVRLPDCSGYKAIFAEPPAGIYSENVEEGVLAMSQIIESYVSKWPEQYIWSMKRFKNRPDGEKEWY